jgi:RHS repeat-associated protein
MLDKPDSMAIAGKSCTYYKYDAAGNTLSKTVKDYKTNTEKRYTYIGGFVYVSNYAINATPLPDTLQYALFEEGRIRWKTVVGGPPSIVLDYMIKDHAGNIRTVLTDEKRRDDYPMATMETANATTQANEEAVYAGLPQTRTNKSTIPNYPADPTTSPNAFVAKVQATAGSQSVGPSITLKVMRGDTVNIKVNSWYKLNSVTPSTPQSPLPNIVSSLINGISGSAVVNTHSVTSTQFTNANSFTPDVTSFLNNQTSNTTSGRPKAYINWIFFDEQFNIVQSASGFEQVGNDTVFKLHVAQPIASKCGFLYVYVSNETPNIPVYFDNLQVSHIRSPLLETSEYYPYGLKMANISYKASMTMTNRYGWNGGNEYEDEGELNYSNTFYRKYDAQIGRFTGIDILAEEFAGINPYQFGYDNPVMFNDPSGAMTAAEFEEATNILMDSEHGGTYTSGSGVAYLFGSEAVAFGWGAGYMQANNLWGANEGWASSYGEASARFIEIRNNGDPNLKINATYNYASKDFSGILSYGKYRDNEIYYNLTKESYYFAGYGDVRDLMGIQDGYHFYQESAMEKLQMTLDGVGMTEIPVLSQLSELISAGISFSNGDISGGFIGLGSMIPVGGKVFEGMKIARRAEKILERSSILLNTSKQLQAKFKHASDFGVSGNYNKINSSNFSSAINQHINSTNVQTILGSYRGQPVTHYLNATTGLNVIASPSGNFISGWLLNPAQLQNVIKHGGL